MQFLLHKSKRLLLAFALVAVLLTPGAAAQQIPDTVEFHLQCYPDRYIPWSKSQSWPSENCDSYDAMYIRSYKDNNHDTVFVVLLDGKIMRVNPRRMRSFKPLDQWQYGVPMELEFDGYFQDKMVRHLVQYWGVDNANDFEFMRDVLSWDTRYLHLNNVRE